VNPSVATSNAPARATVDDLLRDYPPDPKLRAPKQPGETLYVANRREQEATALEAIPPLDIARSPFAADLSRWRKQARQRLLTEAVAWSSAYRDGLPVVPDGATLLLSGHQPEFFHPGVWFKNFVLSEEARASERTVVPVNVLIDYDLCAKRSVVHPAKTASGVRQEPLDIDRPALPLPFERAPIVDRQFLARFPDRLRSFRDANWSDSGASVANPLFENAGDLAESAASFGQFVATARHRYEQTLGLSTLEVPFSRLAEESSFREFAWLLLQNATAFRDLYNASLLAVRQVQKLRSKTHPAPDLVERDGWIEAPFWIWTEDDPRRRRLFVRSADASGLELSDLAGERFLLDSFADLAVGAERLAVLSQQGVSIRPRALAATIWMRMILGDAFIHGIGGAKYDQAADLLMSAWFGIRPPAYLVATATFNLTDRTPDPTQRRLREKERLLRDLMQHPERHLSHSSEPDGVAAVRQIEEALRRIASSGIDAELHRMLSETRDELRNGLSVRIDETRREIATLERELRDEKLLDSRERSFLLFDAETLPGRLTRAAERAVARRMQGSGDSAEAGGEE
jgi:hypothetical protein